MPTVAVLLFQECNWWVAQCLAIDVATQGGSRDEALSNIAEALELQHRQPCGHLNQPPAALPLPSGATEVSVTFGV